MQNQGFWIVVGIVTVGAVGFYLHKKVKDAEDAIGKLAAPFKAINKAYDDNVTNGVPGDTVSKITEFFTGNANDAYLATRNLR